MRDDEAMPGTARNIRGWPWRDVFQALIGLIVGCYLSLTTLRFGSTGWHLVGGYVLFAALFLVFALFRRRYRAMFLGAFGGLTGGLVYLVLFVTG